MTAWGTWTYTSLCDLTRCIPESWQSWLMQFPSPSPWHLKSYGIQVKSRWLEKGETWCPSLKRQEIRTLETNNQSASPLCSGRLLHFYYISPALLSLMGLLLYCYIASCTMQCFYKLKRHKRGRTGEMLKYFELINKVIAVHVSF